MPIFFQQDVDENTRLAIWKIEEEESFFRVPLQREITHPHKRLQHLAGRYLLKFLFPDFPLNLIKIADTRKPFLESEAFHFSISHCGDYAAVIVSRDKRVGIDIEIPDTRVIRIMNKFLHEEEKQIFGLSTATNPIDVTLLWSAKEAMFKWWSRGEVDFSDMLRLDKTLNQNSKLHGTFIKDSWNISFDVNYRGFQDIVLAWVVTQADIA